MIKFDYDKKIELQPQLVKDFFAQITTRPMGGWFNWPREYPQNPELAKIKTTAVQIQKNSDYLVCIGIGGSYLGHRAVIDALGVSSSTKILYIGNSLDPLMIEKTLKKITDHDFSINVISKSGTTTEPAIAYRILKQELMRRYGEDEAYQRIYITTDDESGALHEEAVAHNCPSFVVPDNIGGRYSVLTAVGLLPMAVAGIDIDELLAGAREELDSLETGTKSPVDFAEPTNGTEASATSDSTDTSITNHPVVRYACLRQQLARQNYDVEVLATFSPLMLYFLEWWEQLFGESEGKNHQGIFPASAIYSTDLHSLGQYMQDGRRNIFETIVRFSKTSTPPVRVPKVPNALDGLEYLEDKELNYINDCAMQATVQAHRDGGLPVGVITAPDFSARTFGALFFFFETACALSATIAGVNPFDQPGVEAYKQEMFRRLGKH